MGLIEKHIERTNMRFPVARIKGTVDTLYGVKGYPSSALIDAEGRVVWKGHPASLPEDTLRELLKDTAFVSEVPGKPYKAMNKRIAKGDYGKAHAEAVKGLAKHAEDAGFTKAKEALESLLARKLEQSDAAAESGRYGRAWALRSEVADLFDGLPQAKEAGVAAKELAKMADAKDEIDAWKKIQKADAIQATGEFEKAAKSYRSIVKKYPTTESGKRAAGFLQRHRF